jgi:hypothetical protein
MASHWQDVDAWLDCFRSFWEPTLSLDEAEEDVEETWASEIQRRVAAARAGELASTDWRTVLERVEREVLGR